MSLTSSQQMNEDDDMDYSKWSSIVARIGFPIAVACILVWFLLFTVNTKLTSIESLYNIHATDSRELKNAVDALKNSVDSSKNELKNESSKTNLILQQICINGTAARDRLNCLSR